ncbi:hypothetical protein T07_12963 [Trichinella nelsoni]|uniref:Uncharacterized protein n=1 Tax=Trichinella nelsoni TaxID=6336 RepID=A0A0V0SFF9_9BILA|nr:hypothetical protein T07_12963 [Trichinella nelsoni]
MGMKARFQKKAATNDLIRINAEIAQAYSDHSLTKRFDVQIREKFRLIRKRKNESNIRLATAYDEISEAIKTSHERTGLVTACVEDATKRKTKRRPNFFWWLSRYGAPASCRNLINFQTYLMSTRSGRWLAILTFFHYLVPQQCLQQSDMAVGHGILKAKEVLNWHININSTHDLTKQSPFKVMFGEESSAELKSHPPPQFLLKETTDEEEVEIFFSEQTSYICKKTDVRTAAAEGQKNCAVSVIARSKKSVTVIAVGRCAMLKIPKVNRDPADPRNLPMVVLKINNGLHTVGCRQGILASKYTATDLKPIKDGLLSTTDIQNVEVSVRTISHLSNWRSRFHKVPLLKKMFILSLKGSRENMP